MLSADWGPALRVDGEAPASPFLNGPVAPETEKTPELDSIIGRLPPSLLSGEGGAYDGSEARAGEADAVFGEANAASARLSPATPASLSALKPEPPSPSAAPNADSIDGAARAAGLDPALLRAVVAVKLLYHADASNNLMGISVRTAAKYGYTAEQVRDPKMNVEIGAMILADLLRMFNSDVHRALAAYQVGPKKVLDSGGIPNDRYVKEFMGAVDRALGPQVRAASVPVKPNPAPVHDAVQKVLIEKAAKAPPCSGMACYRSLIEKIADRFGVDPRLMEAIVQNESSGDPLAESKRHAKGLGQLMPDTVAQYNVSDVFNPAENLRGTALYIRHLSKMFNGDKVLIAASYNAGEGRVQRLGRVPRIKETMSYVRGVVALLNESSPSGEKIDVESYMPPPPARRARLAQVSISAQSARIPTPHPDSDDPKAVEP